MTAKKPVVKQPRISKQSKNYIFDERLLELINSGELKTKDIDGLFNLIQKEFNSQVHGLTFKTFRNRVLSLVWNKETQVAMRHIVGNNLPLERFIELNPHIPKKMVESQAKRLTGLSASVHPVTFMRGLGRIGKLDGLDGSFKLPKGTYSHPFVIPVQGDKPYIRIINGVNLGLSHKRLIEDNPIRRALADASFRGVNAVFIVNPIDIEVRKASGGLRILRAMASGLNINLELLDADYRRELQKRSLNDPRPRYETVAERFINALSGYWKVTHKEGDAPEYSGPVYIVLGYKEEEIIASAADWELSYWTRVEQNEIQAELRAVVTARTQARKRDDFDRVAKLSKEIEVLSERKARVITSNISDEDKNKYRRKVLNFVVRELEKNIPNSKVIGLGSTIVKLGDELMELHVPQHLRITDTLLAEYTSGFPGRSVMRIAPETAVICHPHSLGYRMTDREVSVKDRRAEARIFVAPIANDGTFLREVLADSVRRSHQISRAVFNTQFNSGVLDLRFYTGGNVSADPVPLAALAPNSSPRSSKEAKNSGKYIWIMVGTDPHYGSRNREEVWSEKAGKSLGVSDAVIQMFREAGLCQDGKLPIHLYTINDDPTQGNHFETHKQPHARQMSYQQLEKKLQSMPESRAVQLALKQFRVRGSDWLQEQVIQVLDRHIRSNVDFFSQVLLRVEKSGLRVRGVSDIHEVDFDTRDVGAINIGTGNHFESTVDRTLTEGFIYAYYLRALLYGRPEWANKVELIDKLVTFPLEGNQYFAWGSVKLPPNGYEWALEFRADPARMGSWADPLLGAVRNDNSRGDYGQFFTGRKTIKIYGDKHFQTAAKTDHTFYLMGAPGTSTDLYGHRGFPPNNTGVSFLGVPADGPDSGPILVRGLHLEHIRRYFEKPYQFDWAAFLPNPA